MEIYDATIIGAGPAGIATSIELARVGWKVLLIEKSSFPRDKVCGGFIGPENKLLLKRYGILDQMYEAGAQKVTHIHLSAVNGKDVKVPLRFEGREDFGLGFSRKNMDNLLIQKAIELGVVFKDQSLVQQSLKECGDTILSIKDIKNKTTHDIKTRCKINAYGALNKAVASSSRVFGVSALFDRCNDLENNVTMHFVHQGHVGINRFEDNRVNVCYVVKEKLFKKYQGNFDALWNMFCSSNPWINRQLQSSHRLTSWKGTFVDLNRAFQFFDGKSFFVGDAMGIIHPVAGGGISIALNSGILLGGLLASSKPEDVSTEQVAFEYSRIFRKHYYWPIVISKYIGEIGHHQYTANAVIRFLKWREENIQQLFDVFHKPVTFKPGSMHYEIY